MKKIICILICMLFIATTVLPVGGRIVDSIIGNNNPNKLNEKTIHAIAENGMILDQDLDNNNKGYSVIRVWGSDYEMGYAQAELLGDYIVQMVNDNKDYLGNNYNPTREILAEAIWMPPGIEDEFDGMVDCLAITHPSENIDKLDLKVVNTIGDWAYTGCRSHTCWGRYVTEPIKTLSTFRLDSPAIYSSAYHHVLCIRDPSDNAPRWINLAWPGYVITMTGVNEFGTLISNNDYQSSNNDFSADRMPRMVAFRYATTFATDPDVSTHLNTVYSELQNYEIMTGTFLSYYAPEGYGGVMTCNPYESGPDFYNLRLPQESWHHGEAMICTNAWTDGTYTPDDEDFGADDYYDDETAKTIESHWELLASFGGAKGLHLLSLAYRNLEDMTIWAIGKLSAIKKTPRLEYEWTDLFETDPPEAPEIDGNIEGEPNIQYDFLFSSTDPDGNDIAEFIVNWGDGSDDETIIGPFPSGSQASANHTWTDYGTFYITARARDSIGFISPESTKTISMPRCRIINSRILTIFDYLKIVFPILNIFLQPLR